MRTMETRNAFEENDHRAVLGSKIFVLPAVVTEGGKTIWLAGHVGFVDDAGVRSPATSTLSPPGFQKSREDIAARRRHVEGYCLDDGGGFRWPLRAAFHRYPQGNLRKRFSGEHLADGGELCRAGDHGGDHADRGRRRIASWQIAAHSALNHDCLKLNCCGKRFNTKQPCSSRPVRSAKSAL